MADYRVVGKVSGFESGTMKLVKLDGEEVVIANAAGTFCAFSNKCPHAGGPLSDGDIEGYVVTCPWHFTNFDVMTGKAFEGGVTGDPVPIYDVRVEGDDIMVARP